VTALRPKRALTRALWLGTMHGPAELMPISSSGHVALLPWLLRWDAEDEAQAQDGELQKAFEVALHAGTAAALLISLRGEVQEALRDAGPQTAALVVLSSLPPAIVGYALERPIERRLGRPAGIAAGMIAGAVVLALADRAPQERSHQDAGPGDALWLGVGQACALFPGVSRNGATLTAARFLHFGREDAERLSRHVALPVIAGATSLKLLRLLRRGLPAGSRVPFAAGVGASFLSTLASTRLIEAVERDSSLLPFAVYRVGLGATVLRRLWTERSG
jgi:undecaprenyl-diphosphatase